MNRKKKFLIGCALIGTLAANAQVNLINENFESYAANLILDDGITGAKYDLTYDRAFAIADTGKDMLGFYGGSGTNFQVKVDPLNASNKVLWHTGSDTAANAGRGIYMMRLDPTGGGTYTTGSVNISYSFRMMRDGANANSPTNFSVAWVSRPLSLDNGTENLDMFAWSGETVHKSFVTSGNEQTWVSVSGTITADLSTLDLTNPYSTGIRVYATDGTSFVSGGQGFYYLDDFSVTVVPEPSTFALLAGLATLGIVFSRRRVKQPA